MQGQLFNLSPIPDDVPISEGFNPDDVANPANGLFGIPIPTSTARSIIIPVAWDVTTSFRPGTSHAPTRILEASMQVDLSHDLYPNGWKSGIAYSHEVDHWMGQNDRLRVLAEQVIHHQEKGGHVDDPGIVGVLAQVNKGCQEMVDWVEKEAVAWLDQNRLVGVVGGDHSTPLGLLRALGHRYPSFGVLHIDAHLDLRDTYEGFTYSHASILWHARSIDAIQQMVHVGIRDVGQSERELAVLPRHVVFDAMSLRAAQFNGVVWNTQVKDIIESLPERVYVTVDCDGLDIGYCPHTGTPVPGGMGYMELVYLLRELVRSGRRIIGFDLVECGNHEWDATIAARLLYELSILAMGSWE